MQSRRYKVEDAEGVNLQPCTLHLRPPSPPPAQPLHQRPVEIGAILEVDEAATVSDVLDRLQIPPEGRTYVTVNGKQVGQETVLSEDDDIRVVVPLGGG